MLHQRRQHLLSALREGEEAFGFLTASCSQLVLSSHILP